MSARNTVKSIQDIMRQDVGIDGDAQRISQLCWMFFLKIIDDQDQELELLSRDYRSPIPKKYQWRTWAADPEGITGERLIDFINGELFVALKNLSASTRPGDRRRVVRDVFEDAYNYMKSGQLTRQVVNKISGIDFNNLKERQHFGEIYEQILNDLQSAGNAGEYYTPRAVTAFMVDRLDPRPGELLLDPACGTGGFITCAVNHMRKKYVKRPQDEAKMQEALRAVEKKQLPHMLCVTNMLLHNIHDPSFVRHDNTLSRPYISYGQSDRVNIVLTNPPFGGFEEAGIESNFPKQFQTRETADLFLALIVRLLKASGRAAVVLPDGTLFGEGVKARLKEHLTEECNLHTIVRLPNSVFRPYSSIGTNILFFEKGGPTKDIWFWEHRVPEDQKAYSMTRPIRFEHLKDCIEWWGGSKRSGRKETPRAWRVTIEEVKARGYNLDIKNPHTVADDHGDPEVLLQTLNVAEAEGLQLRDHLRVIFADALARLNADSLLAQYDRIANTLDAIPRLRSFILDLAVRGLLVPQDSNDQPANSNKQTSSEKSGLTGADGVSDSAETDAVGTTETWLIPSSWRFAPLETLSSPNGIFSDGDWVESKDQDPAGSIRLIQLADVGYGEYRDRSARFMNAATAERLNCTFLQTGDILIARMPDPLGRACIFPGDEKPCVTVVDVAILRLGDTDLDAVFAMHAINSPPFARNVAKKAAGTTRSRISRGNLGRLPFPVPPLIEQRRIVSKVDELMTLCDHLEASLTAADAARQRLLESLLYRTLVSADGAGRAAAE